MSLTISQPSRTAFGHRSTHEFNPRIPLAKSRFSPKPTLDTPSPVSSLRVGTTPSDDKDDNMSGPHPHRGLPPPSAMALPDPRREAGPPSFGQAMGPMPAPPGQWQGHEESMRNWLVAKAEEDKRKQEEQRTQQETLRLEQRKIEQSMLRESLQGGVPPSMVPMIYAGIGGANLAHVSLDWLQQYASQLQLAHQQIQQSSPDMRRDQGRLIGPPQPAYPIAQPSQQHVLPSQPTEQPAPPPGPIQTTFSAYQPAPARQSQTSAPRSATHTQLPRLTTNEMYVHQPPQPGTGSAHPLQQSQTIQQDQPSSSPSIYFHHWVPPDQAKSSNQPQTPASKGEPHSAHPSSQPHEGEYRESPRKRKAQGGHQANPPPSSAGPQYTSPSFSTTSSASGRKGGHARSRSNASAGRDSDSRPDSRREDPPLAQKHPDSGHTNTSDESSSHQSQPSHSHRAKEEPSGQAAAEGQPRNPLEPPRPGSS
ncbi:Hypothetical predicted protein [Lecanosticta acicola]|uniref:Uncharacterized protein n=1 Tax=Lecanosticta acicola TaxID=111012 RepID=A0AAI8YV49_9PEZI|nr:Hypothetical predicted protein [Lecanosticta acicola]